MPLVWTGGEVGMTIKEWREDFKSFINELDIPKDDYNGIMEYIDDGYALLKEQEEEFENLKQTAQRIMESMCLLKEQEAVPVPEGKINKCECGKTVCRYWHPKFCGFCGRELLWY